jgi:hypothetical protein
MRDIQQLELISAAPDVLRGRAQPGHARGGIYQVALRRKRKNGKVWEGVQTEFRWESDGRKHRRYLRRGIVAAFRRDWATGLKVPALLEKYGLEKPKHG